MKKLLSPLGLLGLVLVVAAGAYAYFSPMGIALRNERYAAPPELRQLLKRFQRLQLRREEAPPALPLIYER